VEPNLLGGIANVNYSFQSLAEWDDYKTGVYTGMDSTWTNTAGAATTGVWKDTLTGLYWSASQGQFSDIFPIPLILPALSLPTG